MCQRVQKSLDTDARPYDRRSGDGMFGADQTQKCIFKIKHTGQEFALNQIDAPREVVLKVVETVCGGGLYHQDGSVKTFTV